MKLMYYCIFIYSDDSEALLGSTNTLNTMGGTENYYYQEYTTPHNQYTTLRNQYPTQ